MKVFFLCRTGHHTSLLAAALYLNYIKENTPLKEIYKLKGYDTFNFKEIGKPFYVGKDRNDNEVYTIGVSNQPALLSRVVGDLLNLLNEDSNDWKVITFVDCISKYTHIGLILKRIGLHQLAAVMFNYGIKKELILLDNKMEIKLKRALMV